MAATEDVAAFAVKAQEIIDGPEGSDQIDGGKLAAITEELLQALKLLAERVDKIDEGLDGRAVAAVNRDFGRATRDVDRGGKYRR